MAVRVEVQHIQRLQSAMIAMPTSEECASKMISKDIHSVTGSGIWLISYDSGFTL